VQLAVLLGSHTGLVVVGEIGGGARQEHSAVGESANVAARPQVLAAPNTLVISAATYDLSQGYLHRQDRGPQALRGVARRAVEAGTGGDQPPVTQCGAFFAAGPRAHCFQ
jgi:class 3 adenylate cyclase